MKKSLLSDTGLLVCSILILPALFSSCTSTKPAKKPVATAPKPEAANVAPALETEILTIVNRHRQTKGLSPLQLNFVINTEARRHSMNMATKRVQFGHYGLSARIKSISTKIKGVRDVAENVAHGSMTAQEVVDSWLSSEGHRKNIEGKYSLTGIGVARNQNSQLYFTQIFAN